MVNFMEKISVIDQNEITIEDRSFLNLACDNVTGVHRELCDIISSSPAIDVSLIINDYRSKVEHELIRICDKLSNLTIKNKIKEYVDSTSAKDKLMGGNVPEAIQQQHHDHFSDYDFRKTKLNLEVDDYFETLLFMEKLSKEIFGSEQVSEEDRDILFEAHFDIFDVYQDLYMILNCDGSLSSLSDNDVSLITKESRPKVLKALQYICDNVSNQTLKEAYLGHLADFKTGAKPTKPPPKTLASYLDNKNGKRMSSPSTMTTPEHKKSKLRSEEDGSSKDGSSKDGSSKDGSSTGSCTPPNYIPVPDEHLEENEFSSDEDMDYEFEKKFIKGEEWNFPKVTRIVGNWAPECVGNGVDLVSARARARAQQDSSEDEDELAFIAKVRERISLR